MHLIYILNYLNRTKTNNITDPMQTFWKIMCWKRNILNAVEAILFLWTGAKMHFAGKYCYFVTDAKLAPRNMERMPRILFLTLYAVGHHNPVQSYILSTFRFPSFSPDNPISLLCCLLTIGIERIVGSVLLCQPTGSSNTHRKKKKATTKKNDRATELGCFQFPFWLLTVSRRLRGSVMWDSISCVTWAPQGRVPFALFAFPGANHSGKVTRAKKVTILPELKEQGLGCVSRRNHCTADAASAYWCSRQNWVLHKAYNSYPC